MVNEQIGSARNGLPNQRQIRTQRKVKVNAQITFVLWLIESLTTIVILIITLAVGSFGQTTLTLNMILYLIALPYGYLANTSDNKNRIVDEGWLNVGENMLKCSSNNNIYKGQNHRTRVYMISNSQVVLSHKGNTSNIEDDLVIDRLFKRDSRLPIKTDDNIHAPIHDECNATDTANKDKPQHEQVLAHGRNNFSPYFLY